MPLCNFGQKQWIQHVILPIEFFLGLEQRKHLMNYGLGEKKNKENILQIIDWEKLNLKYFRIFGSKCYILKDGENLGKFDIKSDMGIFLGYSTTSKTYRVYNQNS